MSDEIGAAFTEHFFPARDGLQLCARVYGADITGSLPVVCLPGLSRNSRDFHRVAGLLSSDLETPRRVIAIDYRGRGRSAWDMDKSQYQIAVEADDVIAACALFGVQEAVFVGTSRGGLILHVLAATAPRLLRAVVLNDIGPVIEIAGLLQIRDYLTAERAFGTWPEAIDHLRSVHGATFPVLDDADWDDMAHAIFCESAGMIVPDFDPALIEPLRHLHAESDVPDLWDLYKGFAHLPLMTIRGEYSTILSEATLEEMARRHYDMRSTTAHGQGHAPLLHRPDIYSELRSFLDAV
ncbi:alpha/beta fold hydrolase [Pararhizobium gei]|uniref:alpha/beta fold hydrolase n=1 Tax=Pararhizobium gei TaxID=1395951 RepID=UPI0023D9A663|nr:alpha/beta hydrolase [Rhizobium gei]